MGRLNWNILKDMILLVDELASVLKNNALVCTANALACEVVHRIESINGLLVCRDVVNAVNEVTTFNEYNFFIVRSQLDALSLFC